MRTTGHPLLGPSDRWVRTAPSVTVAAVLLCVAACGASSASTPTQASAGTVGNEPGRVSLPWPAGTTADATALQRTVDGGAQPWLLDPTEVAQAYARAVGWSSAQITGGNGASPTLATVRSSVGSHTLTLRQPIRSGAGGIWLVTVDSAP